MGLREHHSGDRPPGYRRFYRRREALQEKREELSLKTYHNGEAMRQWNAVMKEQEI